MIILQPTIMSKVLKFQLLLKNVIWRLSPCFLYQLAKAFTKIKPGLGIDFSELDDFKDSLPCYDAIPSNLQDIYNRFKANVRDKLASLKANEKKNEKLMIHSHIIAMCIDLDVCDAIEEFSKVNRGSLTVENYVVKVYIMHGVDPLQQALRIYGSKRPKSYNYYVPMRALFKELLIPREPTKQLIKIAEDTLSLFFKKQYDSPLCNISVGAYAEQVYLDISHAGACIQGEKTEDSESQDTGSYVLQPVEYDTIIYDINTGDLRIHMEKDRKRILNFYVEVVGEIFFQQKTFWGKEAKYTLIPLFNITKAGLRKLLDVSNLKDFKDEERGNLRKIRLCEINYSRASANCSTSTRTLKNDVCLINDLETDDEKLIGEGYQVTRAKFAFDFGAIESQVSTVNMNLMPARRSYEGSEELCGVDQWLEHSGFICKTEERAERPEWYDAMSERDRAKYAPKVEIIDPSIVTEGLPLFNQQYSQPTDEELT